MSISAGPVTGVKGRPTVEHHKDEEPCWITEVAIRSRKLLEASGDTESVFFPHLLKVLANRRCKIQRLRRRDLILKSCPKAKPISLVHCGLRAQRRRERADRTIFVVREQARKFLEELYLHGGWAQLLDVTGDSTRV